MLIIFFILASRVSDSVIKSSAAVNSFDDM
jgi:hypothetical protein